MPPLAIAANAVAICSGVTETPCPKLRVARSMRLQLSTGRMMPGVSPGSSIPVRFPNPNARR